MSETVLIVDDEEGVRRTFQEWLQESGMGVTIVTAADASSALQVANETTIDLAVLDWNLGSGMDGLRLLEDLVEFQPDIVAILITGYANQATPLDALRMGVRDYLDKSQDLNRDSFLQAVRKQLVRIAPAKRQRQLNQSLAEFRTAVEQVLPLIRSAAALNDPLPLPEAVHSVLRFLTRTVQAKDGILVVHHLNNGPEQSACYGLDGKKLAGMTVPFHRSLAASVISLQEPSVMANLEADAGGSVELLAVEQGRHSIMAVPIPVGSGAHVVLELFDKPEFTESDKRLASSAAEIAGDLLRQALAERNTQKLLIGAVESALAAGEGMAKAIDIGGSVQETPGGFVLDKLREGLASEGSLGIDSEEALKLLSAVRTLAVRHGPDAVSHCVHQVESLNKLLDQLTGCE